MFRPVNDRCIQCNRPIQFKSERNYIVWDFENGVYRRECATCHDNRLLRPFERKKSTDPVMHSTTADPTIPDYEFDPKKGA